jgi:hypothetical protein
VEANGDRYRLFLWVSEDATPALRAQLAEVLASLAFVTLTAGTELANGFDVLGAAGSYPASSVTPVEAHGRAMYLVNSPGGFYGLGWQRSGPSFYRDTCRHEVAPELLEIYCPDCLARWDRLGRVISRPELATQDDPLHLTVAKVNWDRQVMLHPRTYQLASEPNRVTFWPDWRTADAKPSRPS